MLGGEEWTWTDEDKEGNRGIIKGWQEELDEIVLVAPEEATTGAIIVVEKGKEISKEEGLKEVRKAYHLKRFKRTIR